MNDSQSALAQGMLRIAIQRMIREHPFHAHMLSPESLVRDPEVKTMGVTIRGGRIEFPYAPEFVVHCSYDELIAMLQHEINHLVFGHVLADPKDYPDSEARVVAEEVSVNEWVTAPLPGQPLTLDKFPSLKPLNDTKERYDFLARKMVQPDEKTVRRGPRIDLSGPKSGPAARNSGSNGTKSPQEAGEKGDVTPSDNHEIWGDALKSPALGKLIIAVAVRDARRALDHAQWDALPDKLRKVIEKSTAGDSPGTSVDNLRGGNIRGKIDWRRHLRHYIANSITLTHSFQRPPRRMPSLLGILPAQCRRTVKPVVMSVIDTSGSVSISLLEMIEAELSRLERDYAVLIVECDAEIQAWYPYRGRLAMVRGRGGTDLRPPLEATFLAKVRPDVIVYFTDGDGIAPSMPPSIPVVWCLTPEGSRPVPWGKEIRMHG